MIFKLRNVMSSTVPQYNREKYSNPDETYKVTANRYLMEIALQECHLNFHLRPHNWKPFFLNVNRIFGDGNPN